MWKITKQTQAKHELGAIELVEIDKAGHKTESSIVLPLSINTDFALDEILDDRAVALLLRDFAELLSPVDDEPYTENGYDRYVDRDGDDFVTPSKNPYDEMPPDLDELDMEDGAILDYVFES